MMACYIGEISESYKERWEPHTVSPDQKEPDVFDVLEEDSRKQIMYRLSGAETECFTDGMKVDWGGWAYKVTKAQAKKYNRMTHTEWYRIPKEIIDSMEEGKTYGIIDVEIY